MKEAVLNISQEKALQNAPKWFSSTKKEAIEASKSLEIPTPRNEEWKFTNLKSLATSNYQLATSTNIDISSILIPGLDEEYIVILNGSFSASLSTLNTASVKSLKTALTDDSELLVKHYNQHVDCKKETFSAHNTAFADDGTFIHLKKGAVQENPIIIYQVSDARSQETLSLTRNVIIAEESSIGKIVVIPITIGANRSFQNIVTEVSVAKNSNIEFNILQNDSENASQVNTTQVSQENNSTFTANTFSLKAEIIRNNMNLILNGEHCEGNMNGLYLLDNTTHVDNHTIADHKYPNCNSNELYKGIVAGKSRGVFNGKIFVRKDAQKTNAFQQNNNIVLSDNAIINTKPQLEIWADDVSCSHGATTGQLDAEALFFLRARGIGKDKARAMLTQAFAEEVTDRISILPLQEHIQQLIEDRLS